jgi:hypothetical protein
MINKKGSEKYLSIWWFACLAIVATSIVVGVFMFYSSEIDTRSFETGILSQKVIRCISPDGSVIGSFFNSDFDILNYCGFSKQVITSDDNSDYLIIATLYDKTGNILKEVSAGRTSFENDCAIANSIESKKYPKCSSEIYEVLYYEGIQKKGNIKILAVSNNIKRSILE